MAIDEAKLHDFLGKAVSDMGAALSACLVMIGDRLGLYKAMAGAGPMTSAELAAKAGCAERYVREWLLNQAAGGYVRYHPESGRYSLPDEQAFCLADESSPVFLCGGFDVIQSCHRDEPKVERAFRTGEGIPWGDHDTCLFCGTERFFGGTYRGSPVGEWIPALAGVKERLLAGGHVADVGCGHAISTILMARAFPRSTFVGFDAHGPSIECARKKAAAEGLKNVTFEVADATSFPAPKGAGGYDLVACFDCLHDMADPVGCARQVRSRLAPGGAWMVVEPIASDKTEENLNPVGRTYSAASTMICVGASLAGKGPALGAQAGPKRLSDTIRAGGFASVRVATTTPFNMVLDARA
ncbi:MAG: class I SAM-dependent methyltransferase [Phycisphaerae bacterium]|nr:class I SAM-dependent methyltransferase [Phycisphaerae bacterium]